jgi:DNA processing protein
VLFHRGDLAVLDARRVGIVGTRSATAGGLRLATTLGRELAEHEVRVVSGLARGIDGAAHLGALAVPLGRPVAVVASGLDVVYPREHRSLWDRVAAEGLLLGERPPGSTPQAMSFPERNRILAALSEIVVVVESRSTGGSLLTAREAMRRDIAVMAVPGSLASRASEGTNELLRDGLASVLLDTTDALVALGLDTRRANRRRFDARPAVDATGQQLLDLIGGDAVTLDELVLRTGRSLADVAVCLGHLEAAGRVARSGGWFVAVP